jgi:hypothetical protein
MNRMNIVWKEERGYSGLVVSRREGIERGVSSLLSYDTHLLLCLARRTPRQDEKTGGPCVHLAHIL